MDVNNKSATNYKYLFFDLDRTLWDYRANSEQTLSDLIHKYVPEISNRFDEFLAVFYEINEKLWLEYRNGRLAKKVLSTKRFIDSFDRLGINAESFAEKFSNDYTRESPYKTRLLPSTLDTLKYLKKKGYHMFLLTNGFIEVQKVKIRESKLAPFFELMITSEEAGYQKPHYKIFEYALNLIHADKQESLMIGDDLETDIYGAQRFGIDTVFFNPGVLKHEGHPKFEIKRLDELKLFL
jgi:putative hydrolase of the HAD superfamily